jgi:tryptophan synthase alpha chain
VLENYIRTRQQQRDILLMTHIVIGYPDLDTSLKLVEAMVKAGVELMELQIPFSEPIADGPVILHANQKALTAGINVDQCFEFAEQVSRRFDIPFLFMSYYNVLFKRGVEPFAKRAAAVGIRGAIVPDLPPADATEYLNAMASNELDPVFIFSPRTTPERMREIASHNRGFVYCVARKGVTGATTEFAPELGEYLARAQAATTQPLAVGFGVKTKQDVDFLRGKADIAVVGSESLRVLDADGPDAVGAFLAGLR